MRYEKSTITVKKPGVNNNPVKISNRWPPYTYPVNINTNSHKTSVAILISDRTNGTIESNNPYGIM